jgi:hypothetical protein
LFSGGTDKRLAGYRSETSRAKKPKASAFK